jgi:hypothetical protein
VSVGSVSKSMSGGVRICVLDRDRERDARDPEQAGVVEREEKWRRELTEFPGAIAQLKILCASAFAWLAPSDGTRQSQVLAGDLVQMPSYQDAEQEPALRMEDDRD